MGARCSSLVWQCVSFSCSFLCLKCKKLMGTFRSLLMVSENISNIQKRIRFGKKNKVRSLQFDRQCKTFSLLWLKKTGCSKWNYCNIFWLNGKENFQVYHFWESKCLPYVSASNVTRTCLQPLHVHFFLFLSQGIFGNAVEILKPLRYKILNIGGSNAQVRECFVR